MRSDSRGTVGLYDSPLDPDEQRRALTGGDVPVAVYGLGKMGLPLATVFAELTGNTIGADVDPDVVDAINRGTCPVDGEPGLPDAVETTVADGALDATDDPVVAAERASIHVIIVPTLVEDGEPDLTTFQAAVDSIAVGLDAGDLVCVESTVPPRTCNELVARGLAAESDLSLDEFGVAFCPERTSSGRALQDIRGAYPKIVGGVDDESTRAASLCYDELSDNEVVTVSDATTAECVKLFEGVYRDVNIALANELAPLADELAVDVVEAIDVANTQPYCDIHQPGPGVGGHCIPYYPYFLIEPLDTDLPLLRTAREVNDGMPAFTVEKLADRLGDAGTTLQDATVVVLGVAYRPGVNETCESPGLAIAERLEARGADVSVVDPIVDDSEHDLPTRPIDELDVASIDGVVLATDHEAFDAIDWTTLDGAVIVDGRNAIDDDSLDSPVYTIGGRASSSGDQN